MKIDFQLNVGGDQSQLIASPEELDGFPALQRMTIPALHTAPSPDRVAVAGVLAFGKYCSGQLNFNQRISAYTAQVVERFMRPRWANVAPLHPANLPLPRGRSRVVLVSNVDSVFESNALRFVPGIYQSGINQVGNTLSIPSNAWLIDEIDNSAAWHNFGAKLGAAVLMGEYLDLSVIYFDGMEGLSPQEAVALRELMSAVGLGITS